MSDVELTEGSSSIPVIDFAPFLDGTKKQEVANAFLDSFKTTGFVYLTNHNIPQHEIDTMFAWSKRFFSQPMEVKQLAPHPPSGAEHVGYSAPGLEKVSQHVYDETDLAAHRAKAPDVKESFEVWSETNPHLKNIWLPDGVLEGFKEACLHFFWILDKVKFTILRALALGLHLEEDFFVACHQVPDNQLRLLHYPSVPVAALEREEVTRIGAHSDFGSITLLVQDNVGGLEVEDPQVPGKFLAVPVVEGALIVNAGDFLMRWSNDIIRSTVHRVRAPPNLTGTNGMTPERYSIPYFCSADYDKVVECLPGTYSEDRPKKYEPISAQEYIEKRLAAIY